MPVGALGEAGTDERDRIRKLLCREAARGGTPRSSRILAGKRGKRLLLADDLGRLLQLESFSPIG